VDFLTTLILYAVVTLTLKKNLDSQIQQRPHFFIQIIVLAAFLQKTGGFARNWLLAREKFASIWLLHP
jgi:hypothetical protein